MSRDEWDAFTRWNTLDREVYEATHSQIPRKRKEPWISVKDKVPPDGERVLVYLDLPGYPNGSIHIGYRREFAGLDKRPTWGIEVFLWDGEGEIWIHPDDEVACWSPLPEPPVEE